MKTNLLAVLLLSFCFIINGGCGEKDTTTAGPVSTDPAVLILGKWQVIKDSISTYQFAFSNGTIPIPGVYYGTATDYWLFQNDGTVIIQEGGPQLSSSYQLVSNNSLLISGFGWGNVNILTLNSNTFIWEKALTSSTNGTYYRRAYFRK
ncbi:MAG: hypothetical protein ACQUYJ_03100 [Ferruginibacter sp.]